MHGIKLCQAAIVLEFVNLLVHRFWSRIDVKINAYNVHRFVEESSGRRNSTRAPFVTSRVHVE